MATGVAEGWTYVTAVYDGRTVQCAVWVLDPANYMERKALVAAKKELPVYRVKRHKALAVRIAELT